MEEVFPPAHVDGMKRFAQIAAVAGALSMLAGFVVYSQQKAERAVGYLKIEQAGASTNGSTRVASTPAVAPGSKVKAPLVSLPPPVVPDNVQTSPKLPVRPDIRVPDFTKIVASSSKSVAVFTPSTLPHQQAVAVATNPPAAKPSP